MQEPYPSREFWGRRVIISHGSPLLPTARPDCCYIFLQIRWLNVNTLTRNYVEISEDAIPTLCGGMGCRESSAAFCRCQHRGKPFANRAQLAL